MKYIFLPLLRLAFIIIYYATYYEACLIGTIITRIFQAFWHLKSPNFTNLFWFTKGEFHATEVKSNGEYYIYETPLDFLLNKRILKIIELNKKTANE